MSIISDEEYEILIKRVKSDKDDLVKYPNMPEWLFRPSGHDLIKIQSYESHRDGYENGYYKVCPYSHELIYHKGEKNNGK